VDVPNEELFHLVAPFKMSTRMKFKVLAHTFSVPMLWLAILLLLLIVPDFRIFRSWSSAVLIGLLCGSLIGSFFFKRKYLTTLMIGDSELMITYLTPLARQCQVTISLGSITNIIVKNKVFLIRDFTSFKFLIKEGEINLLLFNGDVKLAVEQLLHIFPEKNGGTRP
jgi:hypothetical protein